MSRTLCRLATRTVLTVSLGLFFLPGCPHRAPAVPPPAPTQPQPPDGPTEPAPPEVPAPSPGPGPPGGPPFPQADTPVDPADDVE
ncbi:MAG: hypothetical protein Q8P18_16000 [Pseudomonadota bacterium]|nr:hypothetical protein [Pseudomonadota bacterium]